MGILSYRGEVSLTERGRIYYSFFLRFLKENNCFYEYQRAFRKDEFRADRIKHLIKLCNTWDSSVLSGSFIWAATIEGQKFWERLDRKFRCLSYQLTVKPKVVEIETNIITKNNQ